MSRFGLGLSLSKGRAFSSPFDPLSLNPILAFEASRSMLAAGDAAAANLDLVASLENRVSGGANATQTTASKQPRAHVPLGDGHLYIPNVSGNYAEGPSVTIGANETWEGELDMIVSDFGPSNNYIMPLGGGAFPTGFGLIFYHDGDVRLWSKGSLGGTDLPSGVALNTPFNAKYGFDGTNLYVDIDDVRVFTGTASTEQSNSITHPLELNQQTLSQQGNYIIEKAKLTVGSSVVFDCDFSASNIGHGDTSFQAAVGGTVTINTSGNDPATIVRRSFLRFDGASSFLTGSFNESNTTGGYMFVVYSVNGDGGEESGRVFVMNSAGEQGYNNNRSFMWSLRKSNDNNIAYYHSYTWRGIHSLGFDPVDGTLLDEVKAVDGSQFSKVNNGDIQTSSLNLSALSSEEFDIGANPSGSSNPAIDLEALYLFDETLVDEDANKIRDYLNAKSSIY